MLLQGVVTPATIVTACSAALSPLYNWLLVDKLEVGLAGAALANDAVQVSSGAAARQLTNGACTPLSSHPSIKGCMLLTLEELQKAVNCCWSCAETWSMGPPDDMRCTCRQPS